MAATTAEKANAFVTLHQQPEVFAIPNPFDVGSAVMLESLGFQALASTSSGFAQTLGRSDGGVSLDEKLAHLEAIAGATTIPLSADLEWGFADAPEAVGACIERVAATGAVGGSIEDFTGASEKPFFDFELAVERVAAAAEAARAAPDGFVLTARAEQLLRGERDLDEVIKRLQAYSAAGADVLYAPGLRSLDEIRTVADAVDKPLNVLGTFLPGHTVAEIGAAGARRVSIGGALARLMARTLIDAAGALRAGDLAWVRGAASSSEVYDLFARGD